MSQEYDNSVLIAVTLCKQVMSNLNPNTRETVPRLNLMNVSRMLGLIARNLEKAGAPDTVYLPFAGANTFIDEGLLANSDYEETDSAAKEILVDTISEGISNVYEFAIEYYKINNFMVTHSNRTPIEDLIRYALRNNLDLGRL